MNKPGKEEASEPGPPPGPRTPSQGWQQMRSQKQNYSPLTTAIST